MLASTPTVLSSIVPTDMENLKEGSNVNYLNESPQRKYQENKVSNCFKTLKALKTIWVCALELVKTWIFMNSVITWTPVGYN